MAELVGQLLPLAVVIAISPIPIIAVVLTLLSARAGPNGFAFLLGWMAGVAVATTVIVVIAANAGLDTSDGPSALASWLKVGLGLLMLVLAWKQWQGRPRQGMTAQMPSWMRAVDDFSAGKTVAVAFALAAANPKNLSLAIAAGVAIGAAGITVTETVVVVAGFVVIASSSVLALVVGYAIGKERLRPRLNVLHKWLVANNAVVMTVVLGLIGLVVLGQGISGLG